MGTRVQEPGISTAAVVLLKSWEMEDNLKWGNQAVTMLAATGLSESCTLCQSVLLVPSKSELQNFPQCTISLFLAKLFRMGCQNGFSLGVFRMFDFGLLEEVEATSFINTNWVSQKDLIKNKTSNSPSQE